MFPDSEIGMSPQLLFISRKWPPAVGGMETHAVELAEALKESFDVTLLVLPGKPDGQAPSLLGYGWFLLRAIAYCLLRGRAFSHLVLGDLLLFPVAACCRLVRKHQCRIVIVHGLDLVYGSRAGLQSWLYRRYLALFNACQGLFCRIVANSSYTAGLAKKCGLRNVQVIWPALPRTPLTSATVDESALPPGFAQTPRRILQFGRLVPRKGALWFAQNVLPALPDDVELFVVGPTRNLSYLRALEQCPKTHCLGPVADDALAAMIQAADVVIMPNIPSPPDQQDVEGFGLVAVETAALGGILVASRWQGMTDAVIDGVTGVHVTAGDADAWRHALQQVLGESDEQRTQRRKTARLETRSRFTRQRMREAFTACLASPFTRVH